MLLIYIAAVQFALPVIVDPFNVFHTENIRDTGSEPNKHYVKMRYILNNPSKFDSFIFGSSRVGAIHTEKITGEKCYNMTYSAGVPSEHLGDLKIMLNNNVCPKKIYVAVDSVSYTSNIHDHISEALRCPYEYLVDNNGMINLHFINLYYDIGIVLGGLKVMLKNYLRPINTKYKFDAKIFYEYGWSTPHSYYDYEVTYDWETEIRKVLNNTSKASYYESMMATLQDIRDIKKLCDENHIELIVFTNPVHYIGHIQASDIHYSEFLKGIVEITDFYNFSGLNDITLNNKNYLDMGHYKAIVGDMLIDVICNGKKFEKLYEQGFGIKINRDNIDELLGLLKRQWEDYKENKLHQENFL